MAVTIVRTPWIDDDGSGTTGTVLNNAIKTELYGQIDGALAQLVASNGLLNITAFGTHQIRAGGTGGNQLYVVNPTAGATNYAALFIGNDQGDSRTGIYAFASNYTSGGPHIADAMVVAAMGSGGVSLSAQHGSGAIRFYAGGTTERMQITSAGDLFIGATGPIASAKMLLVVNTQTNNLLVLKDSYAGVSGNYMVFLNSADSFAGTITHTGSTTVAYNTTSDQRLKEDLGVAEDLTALRAVVVHDFIWPAHGGHDRGVFAQETFPVFPRAITVGTPGDDLSKPWMTDYSKFVPDLIVGWQEHDRRLARLESLVSERR